MDSDEGQILYGAVTGDAPKEYSTYSRNHMKIIW